MYVVVNTDPPPPVDTPSRAAYSAVMIPQWIIEKKRDGLELSEQEIRFFIRGYTDATIPDYQMAALAMAIFLQGMNPAEIAVLTDAMMHSGDVVDSSGIIRYKADKHSTGGVGDKVSLLLAPLVACCGVAVPMVSGRGLGITGGTLDKLESIPGYRTDLSIDEFLTVVDDCGCSIIGQTAELAPADKKLYALRDVTGTVPSIPLISASIMSKKMAEGIDGLVLDVKCGKGAFMKTTTDARRLADTMLEIGNRLNRDVRAVLTRMDQPLGSAVGNAVEVVETVEALQGSGPDDLMQVTLTLAAHMLVMAKRTTDLPSAQEMLKQQIASGNALAKFREMVRMQGGDLTAIDNPSLLPQARIKHAYNVDSSGYICAVDAECIGRAGVALGAGRCEVSDPVDHAVGITGIVKTGDRVEKGQPAMVILANDEARLQTALEELQGAVGIADTPPGPSQLIMGEVLSP